MLKQKKILILFIILLVGGICSWLYFGYKKQSSFFEIEPTQEKVNLKLKQLKEAGKIIHPIPEDTFCDVSLEVEAESIKTHFSCLETKENVLNLVFKFALRGEIDDLKSPFDEKTSLDEMVKEVIQTLISLKDKDETKSLTIPRINSDPPQDFNVSVTLIPSLDEIEKSLVNNKEIEQVKTDYDIIYYYPEKTSDIHQLEWNPYLLGFNLSGNLNLAVEVEGKILETKSTVGSIDKISDNEINLKGIITKEDNLFQLSWQEYE